MKLLSPLLRAPAIGLLLPGLFLTAPATAAPDTVVEIHRQVEIEAGDGGSQATESRGWMTFGETRARFDQGDEVSWILQPDRDRLLLLHHPERTVLELPLPVRLEDHLSPEERSRLAAAAPRYVPRWTAEVGDETRTFDGRSARRVTVTGHLEENETHYRHELWVTENLPLDLGLYRRLIRNQGAIDFFFRGLAEELAALPGVPLLRRTEVTNASGGRHTETRRLVSVTEREVETGFYQAPEGYRPVDFQVDRWVRLPER